MASSCEASPANKAAVLHGINDLRLQEWPVAAKLPPGQVRVAMRAVGICGSDVHFLRHGRIGDFVVKAPMVIGHESAGVVAEVGEGVQGLSPGDPVALEPGVPCWHCSAAREGRYNLDPDIHFFATPPVHGSLATFVDHPAELCYKLPQGVTLEEGAMCEPLSVGIHACRRAQVQPGKKVAILGSGPIGLITAMVAAAFGADSIAITDKSSSKLGFAAQHCPRVQTLVVNPDDSPAAVAEQLQQQCFAGSAPECVIDCAGFQQTLETGLRVVAPGGKVVMVGMGQEEMQLPAIILTVKEIDLLGSFRYANTYPLCLSLLASKRVNVLPLITHRFGFDASGVAQGFETAATSRDAIKVMFNLQ